MLTDHTKSATKSQSQNEKAARNLARNDYQVFPCDPATKRPMPGVRWREQATSDTDQIKAWWARWPDAMPALPTGAANGLSVVDLDMHGDKDGVAAYAALGLDPSDAVMIVRTAGGGLHLYFDHQEGVRNSATKAGVDVRGEGGYVIAPGAIGRAGTYRLERGNPALAKLLATPFPAALATPARDPDQDQPEPGQHSIAELAEALFKIPNDQAHDDWARMLMAVHHATAGSKAGLALVQAWSADYPGYDPKEVTGKWRSFGRNEGAPVTAESLFAEARAHGWQTITADDFDDLDPDDLPSVADLLDPTPEGQPKPANTGDLTFLTPAQCAASNPRPYIVKGLIAERDVGCIVGAPGVGKSVLAPALAYAVAQGREAHGRRVKAGGVFYVAAEDEHGMRGRVAALRSQHGEADAFTLVGGVTDLLNEDVKGKGSRHFQALRKAIKQSRPALVIIDTLAMAFPGLEENSAEGMGRVVATARALTKWGAAVLLIHHDTKDGQQGLPRGHSLLNGALDMAVHLSKGQDGIVRGRLTKNRNGACDVDLAFRIQGAEIGTDEDGDPVTSAICDPVDAAEVWSGPRLKPTERAALASIIEMMGEAESVDESDWREVARDDARITTAEKPDSRRRVVAEALRGLARLDVVRVSEGGIRLTQIGGDFDFDDLPEESET